MKKSLYIKKKRFLHMINNIEKKRFLHMVNNIKIMFSYIINNIKKVFIYGLYKKKVFTYG